MNPDRQQQLEAAMVNVRRCSKCFNKEATMSFCKGGSTIKVCDDCAKSHLCSLVKGHGYQLQRWKSNTEAMICDGCGQLFYRRKGMSNPRKFCDRENCQRIKGIKNSVARFDTLPASSPTIHTADINYNGKPTM